MWFVLLFIVSVALAALASLVWWRARSVWMWKAALLASEFGYLWGIVPMSLLVVTFLGRTPGREAWEGVTYVLNGYTLGCLAWPWWLGSRRVKGVPAQIAAAFGHPPSPEPPSRLAKGTRVVAKDLESAAHTLTFSTQEGERLQMDLYLPPAEVDDAPVIVLVHGGGWDGGDRAEVPHFSAWLASRGFLVACPDYRLAPKHPWPACAEDIRAALNYLRGRAVEFRGDFSRLFLLGRSAGGQIAQAVAYQRPPPELLGLISLYAPADLEFAWEHSRPTDVLDPLRLLSQYLGGTLAEVPTAFRSASPYQDVNANSVSTLLIHGEIDALVWHRQSERLFARLRAAGVPAYFLDIPWGTHALEYNLNGPSGRLVRVAVECFIAEASAFKRPTRPSAS